MTCVMCRNFSANPLRVDFSLSTLDYRFMNTIFNERGIVHNAPQSLCIRFILGKEQLRRSLTHQPVATKIMMLSIYNMSILLRTNVRWFIRNCSQHRFAIVISPYPCVAEPERG